MIPLSDFGAVSDGSACMADAWDDWLLAQKTQKLPGLVPGGTYRFDKRPARADVDWSLRIQGLVSASGCTLLKNYAETDPYRGLIRAAPGADGLNVSCLFVKNLVAGGSFIVAKASPGHTMTNLVLEHLNLSLADGQPFHHYIFADGSDCPTHPQGIRLVHLANVSCFGSLWAGIMLRACKDVTMLAVKLWPAGYEESQYSGIVGFSGPSGNPCDGVEWIGGQCAGLSLDRINKLKVDINSIGAFGIDNSPNSNLCRVKALCSGPVATQWQNSYHTW